jgi:HAMP domain-containing protein
MRLRTKVFVVWAAIVAILSLAVFWTVQQALHAHAEQLAQQSFDGTKQGLLSMQQERSTRMRQAGRLILSIPSFRALISEQSAQLNPQTVKTLEQQLAALHDSADVNFLSVAGADQKFIAQSERAPWPNVQGMNAYLATSTQARGLLRDAFDRKQSGNVDGLWSFGGRLYQVVAVPLKFGGDDASGATTVAALVMGVPLTDESARELARGHQCQVSFMSDGVALASSLPLNQRARLDNAYRAATLDRLDSFIADLDGTTYHSTMQPLHDPASGTTVGQLMMQVDLRDGAMRSRVARDLGIIAAGGLIVMAIAAAALAAGISHRLREMAEGMLSVSQANLDVLQIDEGRDEVGELAASFNEMLNQMRSRRHLRKRSAFTADDANRELQAPLDSVAHATAALKKMAVELEQAGRTDRLDDVEKQLNELRDEAKRCVELLPKGSAAGASAQAPQVDQPASV